MVGNADPVKQALYGVAGENQAEILPGFAGMIKQPGTHGGRHIERTHGKISR